MATDDSCEDMRGLASLPEAGLLSRIRAAFSGDSVENGPRRLRQRALLSGILLGTAGIVGLGVALSPDPAKKTGEAVETSDLTLHPERAQREAYSLRTEGRIDALEAKLFGIERSLRELSEGLASARRDAKAMTGELREHGEAIASLDRDRRTLIEARSAAADASGQAEPASGRPEPAVARAGEITGPVSVAPAGLASEGRLAMVTLRAPADDRAAAKRSARREPLVEFEPPVALNRAPGSTVADYIPAGSFVRASLLTGVCAPTGGAAASGAMPVVFRVDKPAVLPNRWRSKVERCHVTGTATGDLSSERTLIRLDRLSCVSRAGETLDIRVTGYAVGADGKVGLRSRLVTRSGQAIAAALTTSVLSGLGKAVSLSAQSVTTSAAGADTVRVDNALRAGLGQGAANGFDRVVDYYLSMARNIFPVLEVDSGAPADLVLSQGTVLSDDLPGREGARSSASRSTR